MDAREHHRAGHILREATGIVAIALGILVVIELGLRVAGFDVVVPGRGDAHANLFPFVRETTVSGVRTAQVRGWGQRFPVDKPANGFRVFVLGESSVAGVPYPAEYAFPARLERALAAALPSRAVEVVNCGVPAIGSTELRRIAADVVAYRPDVVVFYAGHNDWILPEPHEPGRVERVVQRLRLYELVVWSLEKLHRAGVVGVSPENPSDPFRALRVRAKGEETLTPADRARILERFLANAGAVADLTRAAGATPVFASVGQNLHDWEPGGSRHRGGLGAARRAAWDAAVARGDAARTAGRCEDALVDYAAALRIDTHPASLEFARAQCLERVGRAEEARRAYTRASDRDAVPLGTPSVLNRRLRGVARTHGALFVDVAHTFERASAPAAPGNALFVDHLHPNLAGHELVARVLARAMAAMPSVAREWRPVPFVADDPAEILRARPDIRRMEFGARLAVFRFLDRQDAVAAELARARAEFPDYR